MRFVLLVLDTHGSTEVERMAFYAELQRTQKWDGWDCLPHTFVARFVTDLDEARDRVKHLDISVSDESLLESVRIAADDDQIRLQVADDLHAAAQIAQPRTWRARIAITDSRPSSIT